MTTDRTAAPARNAALAQPSQGARPAAGKPQAAPTDTFSAMLGAVAPRADQAPRQDFPRVNRRDDHLRPKDATKAKPADEAKPADDAPKAEEATEIEDAPKPARLVTPELFALQMASPLPTAPTEAPAAPAVPAPAIPTAPATPEGQQPQPLPAFAGQVPAGLTAQPAIDPTAIPAATTPADVPATPAPTPGAIPLTGLAGLTAASAIDQQAQVAQPQQPAIKSADVPATPLPDALAQAQNPLANQAQPQTDAGTQGQPQPQPQPQANSQAQVETAKPVDTPAQAPVTNTAPIVAPAPTAPALPINAPTGLQRLVPLYKAPETTATMIQIAAERGVTHARLNLKPVELGGIEVRLRTTSEGVSAHLVADSPEAAKLLQGAADDLRRNLEARDVNLLSLDVSTQSEQQQQRNQQAAFADEFGDSRSFGFAGGRRNGSSADAGLTETPAAAETTLVLPNGVLVDVLA